MLQYIYVRLVFICLNNSTNHALYVSTAIEFYKQALEIFESNYGEDSPEVLKVSTQGLCYKP